MNIFEQLESGIETASADETQQVAHELALESKDDLVIALNGDLGVGKTTFVKGLARAFGIQDLITSPTFNILNTYKGDRTLLHMDAYRIESQSDALDDLMLEDFMDSPFCLAIEWPQNLGPLPWGEVLSLQLSIQADGTHRIQSK